MHCSPPANCVPFSVANVPFSVAMSHSPSLCPILRRNVPFSVAMSHSPSPVTCCVVLPHDAQCVSTTVLNTSLTLNTAPLSGIRDELIIDSPSASGYAEWADTSTSEPGTPSACTPVTCKPSACRMPCIMVSRSLEQLLAPFVAINGHVIGPKHAIAYNVPIDRT